MFNPNLLDGVDVEKLLQQHPEKTAQITKYLKAVVDYRKYNTMDSFKPQKYQLKFFKKGKELLEAKGNPHRALIASNRTGKSFCGTFEVACHLQGEYPDWWPGRTFDEPVDILCLGPTFAQLSTPKAMQQLLCGPSNDRGTGWIRKENIIDVTTFGETVKTMLIKHPKGTSKLLFGSFDQSIASLMGSAYDVVLIDEAPGNFKIFTQMMTRVFSKNGFVMCVFTPEFGKQDVVKYFWDEDQPGYSGLVRATLWDAEHYTLEQKKAWVEQVPEHERCYRIEGIPSAGGDSAFSGVIKSNIIVSDLDFNIKSHWKRLAAVDFGWNDTNVLSFVAKDPDTGIYYFYDEVADTKTEANIIAPKLKQRQLGFIPCVWPTDGDSERGLGHTYLGIYKNAGCIMTTEWSANRWEDRNNKNREKKPGIAWMRQLMKDGLLKVHERCKLFLEEFDTYQFDEAGKLKDGNDHAIDSFRYAITSLDALGVSEQQYINRNQASYYQPEDNTVW